jgi:hypothetical protein
MLARDPTVELEVLGLIAKLAKIDREAELEGMLELCDRHLHARRSEVKAKRATAQLFGTCVGTLYDGELVLVE